jgi:hypothetical protein
MKHIRSVVSKADVGFSRFSGWQWAASSPEQT